MSAKDLLTVLKKVTDKVESSSELYRIMVSNKKAHYLTMNVKDVKAQCRAQLRRHLGLKKNQALDKDLEAVINREVPKFVKSIYEYCKNREMKRLDGKGIVVKKKVEGTQTNFTALFAMANDKPKFSIFNRIKRVKQIHQSKFYNELNLVLAGTNKKKITAGGGFLDIGHDADSTVSKQRQLDTTKELLGFSSKASPVVRKFLNEVIDGITPDIQVLLNGDIQTLSVGLESASANRDSMTKGEVISLNASLKNAIEKLGGQAWFEAESSTSYKNRVDRKIRKQFFSAIKPSNNVRITKTTTDIKLPSKNKNKGKPKRGKVTLGSTVPKVKALSSKGVQKKTSTQNPTQLFGVINSKLPQTVRKNMQLPGLENRTGTFADSVHLTDISSTKQGFPSIGYTYEKNPYQVFEMGLGDQRWATSERDPRTVINKSIREIAAEFAVGRFYTRRM